MFESRSNALKIMPDHVWTLRVDDDRTCSYTSQPAKTRWLAMVNNGVSPFKTQDVHQVSQMFFKAFERFSNILNHLWIWIETGRFR